MSHEPECMAPCCPWMPQPCDCQCDCDRLRSAYERGVRTPVDGKPMTINDAYRLGYLDALKGRQFLVAEAYEQGRRDQRVWNGFDRIATNQHGQGENP